MKKQIKKTAVFTTTISGQLLEWLNNEAKMQKTTKRQVMEDALNYYKIDAKRKALAKSFKRAAKDPETQEMAEWGIGEYSDMLNKSDK